MKPYLHLMLPIVALTYLVPSRAQTPQEVNSKAQEINAQSQRLLDEQSERFKRAEELLKRQEQLMGKQEASFKRFETILDVWEKQQKQYQGYLDTLPKK
ncbi:MAG: hypothetical protein IPK22_04845 [Verrucomicrobiaceae bacterium]|nr:hypothetical protein [Verrucomicrobiaceae bacterium]